MSADRFRFFSRRSRVWLVWLALLLPAAQAAATWHTYSIAPADSADQHDRGRGRAALHPVHCDLCLTAAALSASASPAAALQSPRPAGRHESPPAICGSARFAPPAWTYRSRAPPLAPH